MATENSVDEDANLLEQIDQGLGRYYSLNGKNDYFNSDNVGKFMLHAEDGGIDTNESILNELSDDPKDCILCDFDDDFPIKGPKSDRFNEIYRVIQECVKNKDAYKGALALYVTANDFNVSKQEIESAVAVYRPQCPSMFKDGKMENDKSILKLIAMSQRLGVPYLIYLASMYQRERVLNIKQNASNDLKVEAWCRINKHCQELAKMDQKNDKSDKESTLLQDIEGGVFSYFHRIMPKLMLTPTRAIVDSLEETCEYIADTVAFVSSLANDKELKCPFQYDAVFAFNNVIDQTSKVTLEDFSEDDEEESEKKSNEHFFDCFGDIKQKLSFEKLLFSSYPITDINNKDDEKQNDDALRRARVLKYGFDKFKNTQIKKKYEGNEFVEYPRKHRFCSLIDRRKPNDGDNANKNILKEDELIMFEPPNNCNSFPKDKHVPLFYFDTTLQCVIPSNGYNEGDNNEAVEVSKYSQSEKQLKQTITSKSNCNGAMIMLSFHVEASDEIRCYLYINGQVMRFMPSDIINLLPLFFDKEFGENAEFVQSERAQHLIDEMSKNLRDDQFYAFFKKYKSD